MGRVDEQVTTRMVAVRQQLRERRSAITPGPPAVFTVGVLVTVVLVAVSAHVPTHPGGRALDPVGYVLLGLAGIAVGGCGRWPRSAVLVVTVVLCVFVGRDYPNGPVWLTGPVSLAGLSWRATRRAAIAWTLVMLAALSGTAVGVGQLDFAVSAIFVGWSAAAVLLGEALRSRRSYLAGLAERARFLQRSREDELARRLAEERLRIARDLHDSVAHAMATITVQAGAAGHVLAHRPEAAGPALAAIQQASAEVLEELGSMLAVLRGDAAGAERAPAPGLTDVRRLVESLGPSAPTVELRATGTAETVAAAVGTAGYRVVQESLTNVLRHSRARSVRVRLDATADGGLSVEISDPGPARPPDDDRAAPAGAGVGVRGMRERVSATGGRFSAGPTAAGGYLVRATWSEARGAVT